MSLAILPSSPITYGQTACVPTLLPPAPPSLKRPRLTLDTNGSSSVFGKPSTSLRLETLSATSPTARNTFRNGYDATREQRKAGSKRPALTPLSTTASPDARRRPTPLRTELPGPDDVPDLTSSSAVSSSSISTVDSLSAEVPYKLAYNITSILSNGPIPRIRTGRNTYARSRSMFPAAKKVAFRAPLTEEIKTTKYTVAHSEVESSLSSIATDETPEADDQVAKAPVEESTAAIKKGDVPVSPHRGEKRESSDEEDSDTCPATPVAGRRKKSRVWRWTLGPVDGASKPSQPDEVGIGEEKTEGT